MTRDGYTLETSGESMKMVFYGSLGGKKVTFDYLPFEAEVLLGRNTAMNTL